MGSIKSLLPMPPRSRDCTDKIYDFLDKKSLSRPFRKCAALVCCCYLSLQGDHSRQKNPLVDFALTVSAANGPLL